MGWVCSAGIQAIPQLHAQAVSNSAFGIEIMASLRRRL